MDIAPPTDPLAAVTHPDPYAYYAELAKADRPEWNAQLGLWVAANPAHVAQILHLAEARVAPPEGAPPGYAEFARFSNGEEHARFRADVIERMENVRVDDPLIALDDVDAFVERFAIYALVHDIRANVKGDLLFQSHDAVRALIGNALAAIAEDPSLGASQAIRHALRFDPPVHNTRRTMVADVDVAGAHLRAGETVLLILVTMTFGLGIHACPGESLAVRIATMAVERVLASGHALHAPTGYAPRPNVRIPLFNDA